MHEPDKLLLMAMHKGKALRSLFLILTLYIVSNSTTFSCPVYRATDNWKALKELEKAVKVYWDAKDRLPPRVYNNFLVFFLFFFLFYDFADKSYGLE